MKKIYLIAAVIALACGALVYMYFSNLEGRVAEAQKEHAAPAVEMTNVVVASADIPPYTDITEEMIAIERFPAAYVNENMAVSADEVLGLQSDGHIVPGEMIMTTALGTAEEVAASLSGMIPEGMRAMTMSIATSSGVGGYIVDGDHVDLLCFIEGDEETGAEPVASIALSDVPVLRIGNVDFTPDGGAIYSSLTFALTPAQTLKLYELMNKGSIYCTLCPREKKGGDEQ